PHPRLLAALARLAQRLDQLLRHSDRQRLAGLALPDHEPAAGILARPARVALAVLADLAPADRAGAQLGPLDLDALELFELLDGLVGELGDVAHERLATVLALLDQPEPLLPAAGQ